MASMESSRQDDVFIAVSVSPDPCKTPPNNVPVPYNVVAKLGQSLTVSPDVRYKGLPVVLAGRSSIGNVTGDEAGTGGGVKSGSHQDEVKFIEGSCNFIVNGMQLVREKDPVSMNKGNTTGKVQSLTGAAPAGGVDPDGMPMQPSNPPLKKRQKPASSAESTHAG